MLWLAKLLNSWSTAADHHTDCLSCTAATNTDTIQRCVFAANVNVPYPVVRCCANIAL